MQLTASEKKVTSVKQGFRVAAKESLKIAPIRVIVNDDQFLNDNHYNIFIVSAKDALPYANNEPLEGGNYKFDRKSKKIIRSSWDEAKNLSWNERLYISDKSAKIIKKTQEDGKERLLAFDDDLYGRNFLDVSSGIRAGYDVRVAGKRKQAMPNVFRPPENASLEITFLDGSKKTISNVEKVELRVAKRQ